MVLRSQQSYRRRADQHELARDLFGRDAPLKHVGCRDIDRRIVGREMNPKLAVAVGRNLESFDGNALDTRLVGFDENGVGPGRHTQYLETQRGHGGALRLHDHRHSPNDAVALGLDRKQTPPGGRLLQNWRVAQQSGKLEHESLRVLARAWRALSLEAFLSSSGVAADSPDSPNTTRERRMASAKSWSLLGRARSLALVSSSRLRNVSAATSGLSRSDSAKMTSKAITTAPSLVRLVMRSAITRPRPRPLTDFAKASCRRYRQ